MIMKKVLILIFICTVFGSKAQDKFTVSGYAKDAKNGEALIGVTVYKKITKPKQTIEKQLKKIQKKIQKNFNFFFPK